MNRRKETRCEMLVEELDALTDALCVENTDTKTSVCQR